jgi:CHAD domain-containing protein
MLDETAEEWLSGRVRRLCVLAKRDLERLARYPEEAVHALRVRMKKLRAVLRLGKGQDLDLSEMDEHCRSIQRGLSKARDDKVMLKLHVKLFDQVLAWQGEPAVQGWSVAKVRREVEQLSRLVAGRTYSGLTWERVQANQVHSLKRARKAAKRCQETEDAASFHALRKWVKVLLFQSQALPESSGAKRRIRLAKALGKRLGREHDLAVLAEMLTSRQGDPERLARVEKRRLQMHDRIRKEAAKLLRK